MKHKKLKIINRKRFIIANIILGFIIFGIIFIFTHKSLSYNESAEIFETIRISKGDTLWVIANNLQLRYSQYNNKDIREIIFQIKKANNLKNCNLQIGQKLKIPII